MQPGAAATAPSSGLPAAMTAGGKRRRADEPAADMDAEAWAGLRDGLLEFLAEEMDEPEHAEDAAGNAYVSRPLLNGDAVSEWAQRLGLKDVVPADKMRMAVGFSRGPVPGLGTDRLAVKDADGELNGTRSLERMRMNDTGPVVLRFRSPEVMERRRALDESAKYRPEERPYVVIAGDPGDVDLSQVAPYSGSLEFGPEEASTLGDGQYGATGQVLFISRKGKVLFLRRASGVAEAGEWDLPGGHIEQGEDAQTAARRESLEETGVPPPTALRLVDRVSFDGEDHTTFAAEVGKRFKPALSEEHVDWKWADPRKPPQPLRPVVAAALAAMSKSAAAPGPVDEEHFGAAVMYVEPDGRILFLKRGQGEHAGRWDLPGGRAEEGEEPEETAIREATEEAGREPTSVKLVDKGPPLAGAKDKGYFATFASKSPRFVPKISDEHSDHLWAHPARPPRPLHPGVAAVLTRIADGMGKDVEDPPGAAVDPAATGGKVQDGAAPAQDSARTRKKYDAAFIAIDRAVHLAFDEKPASSRWYDADGRLHVDGANICREGISPYVGHEIPGWEELGLDPNKIYKLYRPAEELEKAVATSNGIPLLREHRAVSADDHSYWDTVGSIGTRAEWAAPFVKNDLVVWPAADIEGVEKKDKCELSPGYRYKPKMDPGKFDGEDYDGRMTDICFNHEAIVETGRQGPEVVIGDSAEDLLWDALADMVRSAA